MDHTPQNILIRPATASDLPAILGIANYIILNTTTNYNYDPETLGEREQWFRQKEAQGLPVIVAEIAGQTVGFSTYGSFRDRIGYRFTVEHSVYIHQDYHRLGIGRRLLERLIELAQEQGFHTMIAGIDTQNQGSVEFHRRMGFEQVAHFREVGFKFDQWLDLIFMQLWLS